MDAVILAAGHGTRLEGIVPRYWKPLLVVDGMPLVASAVERALDIDCTRIVLVVSPQNAAPMTEILPKDNRIHLVIQRHASGPGDALLRGLELTYDKHVLVLMGDNISSSVDVSNIAGVTHTRPGPAIAIRLLRPTVENETFTRRRFVHNTISWHEKEPYALGDVYSDGMIRAWVGPIVVDRKAAVDVLNRQREIQPEGVELPIGPYLQELCPNSRIATVSTVDVGTPDETRTATAQ